MGSVSVCIYLKQNVSYTYTCNMYTYLKVGAYQYMEIVV